MTKKQWQQFIDQWRKAGAALEKIKRTELRKREYDYGDVDALLEIGDMSGQSRATSGLVEMQRWFRKLAERQGILPKKVRGKPAPYRSKRVSRSTKRGRRT